MLGAPWISSIAFSFIFSVYMETPASNIVLCRVRLLYLIFQKKENTQRLEHFNSGFYVSNKGGEFFNPFKGDISESEIFVGGRHFLQPQAIIEGAP